MKRLHNKALLILIPLSLLSAFIEPRKVPLSILAGGVLALLNFRGLSKGLESLLGIHKPAMKLLFLGIFRLLVVSTAIVLLAFFRLVNLPALAAGFTVVVILVVVEGYRTAMKEE